MTPDEQALVDDLRAQLAEGAETLGRERALWIEAFAKQQAVVDAACESRDKGLAGNWGELCDAVEAYRAKKKGQG